MAQTIRVLSTIAMRTVLDAAVPAFEHVHGVSVQRVINSSIALMRRIAEGETADVALFTAAAIDELIAQGKMLARIDLVRSGGAVAVCKGAPKPDIGTAEKFRQALLSAKSVAHSKTGASGIYFVSLIERLVIAELVRIAEVAQYPPDTDDFCHEIELVVAIGRGGRDIDPAQVESLHIWGYAAGLDLTRRDLQQHAKRTGGPWEAAKAFVAFLASPAQAALIRANGMEPV